MNKERVSSSSSSGIGFTGLLTIVFIVLKLTGYIDWSWWWVLSPIWISVIAAVVVIVAVLLIVVGIPTAVELYQDWKFVRNGEKVVKSILDEQDKKRAGAMVDAGSNKWGTK